MMRLLVTHFTLFIVLWVFCERRRKAFTIILTWFFLLFLLFLFSASLSSGASVPLNDGNQFYNSCNCSVGLDDIKDVSTVALFKEEIGYRFPLQDACDWTAFRSCVGQCVIFFPAFTNNFDLSSPPNVPNANGTTLNDLLCKALANEDGTVEHSFASRAHLYATVKCFVSDHSIHLQSAKYKSGSLMFSQQLVDCDRDWIITFNCIDHERSDK